MRAEQISIDALVDDLIGLNWRAVKTLVRCFTHPRDYVEAAWSEDWCNRYTPSFRLWFTLIAILFFFQFFWASDDSALIHLYASNIEASGIPLPAGVTTLDASGYFARINFAILPLLSAFSLFLLGLAYRAWGEPVPFVVRVRYAFAVVIPSTLLTLPVFGLLGVVRPETASFYLVLSWALPFLVDAWIAWRGPLAHLSAGPRLWRSVFFSASAFVVMLSAAMLSTTLATLWIRIQHG